MIKIVNQLCTKELLLKIPKLAVVCQLQRGIQKYTLRLRLICLWMCR